MKKTITILTLLLCVSFSNSIKAQDAFLGDIKMTAITFNQRDWLPCEGQLLAIASNTALFSLLGTTYGGNGTTTFGLPDLRSRVPVGFGQGSGLTNYNQGQKGGAETNTLTTLNLPEHNHSVLAVIDEGNSSSPASNYPANTKLLDKEYATGGSAAFMNSNMIGNTGSGEAVNNIQPYIAVRYVICISGIYPSRN